MLCKNPLHQGARLHGAVNSGPENLRRGKTPVYLGRCLERDEGSKRDR